MTSVGESTTPVHGITVTEDERFAQQQTAKRARIDAGGENAVPTYVNPANDAPSTAGGLSTNGTPAATISTTTAALAPLSVPLSPLLTQHAPSWISEVPQFLEAIQQHEPTIPDEVVQYLLERSGCNCTDSKLVRLVSIATQHFLDDVMRDARQFQKLRNKDKTEKDKLANTVRVVCTKIPCCVFHPSLTCHARVLSSAERAHSS